MRVLKFAWHLFWAARRCPRGVQLAELVHCCEFNAIGTSARFAHDTELTEALRRYGR